MKNNDNAQQPGRLQTSLAKSLQTSEHQLSLVQGVKVAILESLKTMR